MLDPETLLWFDEYRWPGNIRELENLVVREYLLAEDGVIHIPLPAEISSERSARTGNRGDTSGFIEFNVAKSRAISEFERHYLVNALSVACGNVTQAAILVGKERRAFGKLLKKHGIDKAEYARQFR
jgi:DNA-binding NtrC family response regulator